MKPTARADALLTCLPLAAAVFLTLVPALTTESRAAQEATPISLREQIDRHVERGWREAGIPPAARSSDAEFLRRVYLDLTGSIPPGADARMFIDDPSRDKRAQLVDRLLGSPEYARHMARVFDVLLMERRPDKHVPSVQWTQYLRASFAQNKPWDALVREILTADGVEADRRAAAKFYLDRDAEPHLLTRDISRLFLGLNLQCSQCHDHPLVVDYEQDHYYGLFAFLNRTQLFTDKNKLVVLAEKADGDVTYTSVFDKSGATKATGPKLLGGPAVGEPPLEKGKEYEVAPANGVRPVPKFSRRAQLGPLLTAPETLEFRRNIANRLWALLMGRGIVEPLDMHHGENPASHPELLELLAGDLLVRKFDVKAFLRELLLSEVYQQSSELPPEAQQDVPPESFAVARLKPLSAEQLAWSVMQATGLTDAQRKALGDKCNDETLHDRLVGNVPPFISRFAGPSGQSEQGFQATVDQVLFIANGATIRGWLAPRPGNLTDRLLGLREPEAIADELYLSVLARRPTEEERYEVEDYLRERTVDRPAAIQQLTWALLASTEFRFNH